MTTLEGREDNKLHVSEIGVLGPEPDVAVGLSHMVPPENDFHPHLCILYFHVLYIYALYFVFCIYPELWFTNEVNNKSDLNDNVSNSVYGADTDCHPTDCVVRKS